MCQLFRINKVAADQMKAQNTEPIVVSDRTVVLSRLMELGGHFLGFALSSVVASIAITSGPHSAWASLLRVGLTIGLADTILERILEWIRVPPQWASTTIFLIVANAAFFGIADRVGVQDPNLKFAIDGFVQALAGAVLVVALSIVLRRATGRLATRRSKQQTQS